MERRIERVLDAAAFLNTSFFSYENAAIPPSVASEIRSRSAVLEALVDAGKISIVAPSGESRERIRKIAKEVGELNAISEADIDALALALEKEAVLITDDFHVQNVARFAGIKYMGVTGEIRKARTYVLRCTRCGKTYPLSYRGKRCKICGGKLAYFSNSEFSST